MNILARDLTDEALVAQYRNALRDRPGVRFLRTFTVLAALDIMAGVAAHYGMSDSVAGTVIGSAVTLAGVAFVNFLKEGAFRKDVLETVCNRPEVQKKVQLPV